MTDRMTPLLRARAVLALFKAQRSDFDPDQPRAQNGQWGAGGFGGGGGGTATSSAQSRVSQVRSVIEKVKKSSTDARLALESGDRDAAKLLAAEAESHIRKLGDVFSEENSYDEAISEVPTLQNEIEIAYQSIDSATAPIVSSQEYLDIVRTQDADRTPSERNAEHDYAGGGYTVNSPLRNGTADLESPLIRNLDSMIEKTSMPDEAHVFRGVHGDLVLSQLGGLEPGDAYIEKGYSSTSADPDLAFGSEKIARSHGWSESKVKDLKVVRIRITVPKGGKGAAFRDDGEMEVLLPRNQRFVVTKVDRFPDGQLRSLHVTAEQSQ